MSVYYVCLCTISINTVINYAAYPFSLLSVIFYQKVNGQYILNRSFILLKLY